MVDSYFTISAGFRQDSDSSNKFDPKTSSLRRMTLRTYPKTPIGSAIMPGEAGILRFLQARPRPCRVGMALPRIIPQHPKMEDPGHDQENHHHHRSHSIGLSRAFRAETIGYIRTSLGYVHDSVQNSVPVGFEIDHARQMIQDLVPEVRKNMHVIAKEEVEVQRLEEQIANSEAKLAKDKEQLLRLKTDLAAAKDAYQYGGRGYTAEEVRTDLANRFERYKTAEATLTSLKQVRDAR